MSFFNEIYDITHTDLFKYVTVKEFMVSPCVYY